MVKHNGITPCVYRVVPCDQDDYASLAYVEDQTLLFDGAKLPSDWIPPRIVIYNPKLPLPTFPHLDFQLLVFTNDALDASGYFVESGQVFRMSVDGQSLSMLNITNCINALESTYLDRVRESFGWTQVMRYKFRQSFLPEDGFFKVPESPSSIFYVRGECTDPPSKSDDCFEPDFMDIYKAKGWTGLAFEFLWRGDEVKN